MRHIIFLLAALQLGPFAYVGLGFGTLDFIDPYMQVEGFVSLTGMALAVCLVPALVLALVNKFMGAALALALVPISAFGLFLYNL